jgi:hypothetical protein
VENSREKIIMVRKIYKKIDKNKKRLLLASVSGVLLLFFLYIFGLNTSVFNTAEIISLKKELDILNHKVGSLEFELINTKNQVNTELAQSLGFQEAKNIKFIQRKSVATIIGASGIQ